MGIKERLINATEAIWEQYHSHPFVMGIADGTLPIEKFKYYIIQDYLYLLDYTKVFAVGIAKAKSPEMIKVFAHYIKQITEGEMDIHRGYMPQLGITEKDIAETPAALDNISYTSYMLRIAYEECEAEILAAILACAYSYEVISNKIVERFPQSVKHPVYGEWIKGYSSVEYSKENVELFYYLDKYIEHYTEPQLQHLVDIFINCSRYEAAFWDFSWNMSK